MWNSDYVKLRLSETQTMWNSDYVKLIQTVSYEIFQFIYCSTAQPCCLLFRLLLLGAALDNVYLLESLK